MMRQNAMRLIIVVPLLLSASVALAQSGGSYHLSWWTVDSGGGTSSGGHYALSGTVGQPDAGALSSGNYTLAGGFWAGATGQVRHLLYLPLVYRSPLD